MSILNTHSLIEIRIDGDCCDLGTLEYIPFARITRRLTPECPELERHGRYARCRLFGVELGVLKSAHGKLFHRCAKCFEVEKKLGALEATP